MREMGRMLFQAAFVRCVPSKHGFRLPIMSSAALHLFRYESAAA